MEQKINLDILIKYIKNISTTEEKKQVEKWINASKENKRQYESFLYYWNISKGSFTSFNPDIIEGWENISKAIFNKPSSKPLRKLNYFIKIAASILILIGLGFGTAKMLNKNVLLSEKIVYTSNDEIKQILLDDNTLVWLNKNSELIVSHSYNVSKRKVALKGEAYFDVERNPDKPFIVKTNKTITQVLGTSFNIKSNEKYVNVTVETGKVAFYKNFRKSGKVILEPGNEGIYSIDNNTIQKNGKVKNNYLAWKTKKLEFNNTDFNELCETLSEYYNITIITDSLPDNNLVLTSSFNNATLQEALEIIEFTLDIKFIETNDGYIPQVYIK